MTMCVVVFSFSSGFLIGWLVSIKDISAVLLFSAAEVHLCHSLKHFEMLVAKLTCKFGIRQPEAE